MNHRAETRESENNARERRCIVTGEVCPVDSLIRFVAAPDGQIVPDFEGKLPGRGLWVTADREILTQAAAGPAFAKALHAPVRAQPDLPERVERLLRLRMCDMIGLARRAGLALLGFDTILRAFDSRLPPRLLIEAAEASADGRRKLLGAAHAHGLTIETIDCLGVDELRLALGRENVIHAAVKPGALADRLVAGAAKLRRLRALPVDGMAEQHSATNERNA